MRRVLLLLTLVAGCSFPDPVIDYNLGIDTGLVVDAPGADTGDGTDDTSAEDTGQGDVTTDVADGEGGMTDSKADESVCETLDPCDCDGDGDRAIRTGCAGGRDCDDGDGRRNSKVTSFQEYTLEGVTTHKGDWDCSGKEVTEYTAGTTCAGLLLGDCSKQGYKESTVTCGAMATFIRCKWSGIACVEDATVTMPIKVKCK